MGVFDKYECNGQMDIFDFVRPAEGYKCETCVYYQSFLSNFSRLIDGKPSKSCVFYDQPGKKFNPVVECNQYKPNTKFFKCCETCYYGNVFCKDNCWLVDKEGKDTPNRHHREGFPDYGKDYHDNHCWDICDMYKTKDLYKKNEELK